VLRSASHLLAVIVQQIHVLEPWLELQVEQLLLPRELQSTRPRD
jgi:hypothetical protein